MPIFLVSLIPQYFDRSAGVSIQTRMALSSCRAFCWLPATEATIYRQFE